MTASAPIPAAETAPRMANSPDTAAKAPTSEAPPTKAPAASPTLRSQIAENPLLSFFGLLIVALLGAAIAGPNIRINDTNRRIDRLDERMVNGFAAVDARLSELEDEMDARFREVEARFAEVEARFAEVDARFDEIDSRLHALDLKLTALIAGLGATDVVDAATDGRMGSMGGSGAMSVSPDS